MKIMYVPLDERPCNYEFPKMIASSREVEELLVPSLDLMGQKKKSANINGLWDFVETNIKSVDAAVISIDTLLFGGLIPSRVHELTHESVDGSMDRLRSLKILNPNVKLYAFECIMRSPSYDSAEEEPEYYEDYGYALYRRAYLNDKKERETLDNDELSELKEIEIPSEIIADYETRRSFNLHYNLKVAELVNENLIDFLVIPQDDSSQYGYTAQAQKSVIRFLGEHNLESRIAIYPGADEVGCSLLARCLNEKKQRQTKVYAFYSSILGPTIVANYEDRPIHENLKYHLDVTNSYLVDTPADADFILAINTPGKIMEESFNQEMRDVSYTSFRNLRYFTQEITRFLDRGYKVAVCDSAFSNGGDLQLIKFLDEQHSLHRLLAYAGWNTNSNTLGTVVSSAIFSFECLDNLHEYHLVYRILEDVFYQSYARQVIIEDFLETWGISYYDFKDKQSLVERKIEELIQIRYNELIIASHIPIEHLVVSMPWKRMFELGMTFNLKKKG